jgi:hypothetical protein
MTVEAVQKELEDAEALEENNTEQAMRIYEKIIFKTGAFYNLNLQFLAHV